MRKFYGTAYTDVGTVKTVNQDSLMIRISAAGMHETAFAVVCDGMGGLAKGEVASKEVIYAFCDWFDSQFAEMIENGSFSEGALKYQWLHLAVEMNEKIKAFKM